MRGGLGQVQCERWYLVCIDVDVNTRTSFVLSYFEEEYTCSSES